MLRRIAAGRYESGEISVIDEPASMKRFYKTVTIAETSLDGFQIHLDGRPIRTPAKSLLQLPSEELAIVVADEWSLQGEDIAPATMPFTQLANSALDLLGEHRQKVIAVMVDFINADLICYRAKNPKDLVENQSKHWQPLVDWFNMEFDTQLVVTTGILHVPQNREVANKLDEKFAKYSDFQITGLHELATITKSITIALAVVQGRITTEQAWQAAHVDEDHQAGRWGEDDEAAERAAALQKAFGEAAELWKMVSD